METAAPKIAYFCMEYGLTSGMKTYSGGLGILAGDTLKAARELDAPFVGIGLKWKQGYTRQVLDENHRVCDVYHNHAYENLTDTGVEPGPQLTEAFAGARWQLRSGYATGRITIPSICSTPTCLRTRIAGLPVSSTDGLARNG